MMIYLCYVLSGYRVAIKDNSYESMISIEVITVDCQFKSIKKAEPLTTLPFL
jgi:hypothetical protein